MGKKFKKRDNYAIKIGTELVLVTREVYEEYHKMERREAHLRENVYFWKDENGKPIWKDTYIYARLDEDK